MKYDWVKPKMAIAKFGMIEQDLSTFSKGCNENMGPNGQNEPWASLLASILSYRQPLEIFYQEDTQKCLKQQFLAFRQIN